MKREETGKRATIMEKPADNKQVSIIVGGCKVKLNFPSKPDDTAINEVKRMMLGGVTKP